MLHFDCNDPARIAKKFQDVEKFSTMFLNYDLLARRWVRHGYIYPFLETGADCG
tara:strand:- start:299 stop:460 length:162 start_codon:yes stop_codon:yes gene_type:complete